MSPVQDWGHHLIREFMTTRFKVGLNVEWYIVISFKKHLSLWMAKYIWCGQCLGIQAFLPSILVASQLLWTRQKSTCSVKCMVIISNPENHTKKTELLANSITPNFSFEAWVLLQRQWIATFLIAHCHLQQHVERRRIKSLCLSIQNKHQ